MQHVIDDQSYPQSQVGEPRILNDLLAHVLVLLSQKGLVTYEIRSRNLLGYSPAA